MDEREATASASDPLEWLLSRRLVRPEQVDECRRACDGKPEDVVKLLVARGYVDPVELGAMHRAHVDSSATALASHDQATARLGGTRDSGPPPPRKLAQFEILSGYVCDGSPRGRRAVVPIVYPGQ